MSPPLSVTVQQFHPRVPLSKRTLRSGRDAMSRRCLDDRTQRVRARLVPRRARLAARCRPPAIAIHDNRNMDAELFCNVLCCIKLSSKKKQP
jgi:hypothetical protein